MSSENYLAAKANNDAANFETPACDPKLWRLDPQAVFLNHGSFGSCPVQVLEFQQALRDRLERQPVKFFVRDLEGLLDEARAKLARFVGAAYEGLVFVPNATAGVNTILRSLDWSAGDELLVTNHEYNACRNALDYVAEHTGAKVVEARVPFPLSSAEEIVEAVCGAATARTRLALLDHVTSQTGLLFPIQRLVRELAGRGVETLVDGAHAPGMVPLNVSELGAAYYTGNCHKWLCAPKGAGFLHVRGDRQKMIRPLSISHGANSSRLDRSRYLIEFGWTGTWDPTAFLAVPEALRYTGSLLPGGWPELMRRNRELVLRGRNILCAALGIPLPCPEDLIGALASVPLPDGGTEVSTTPLYMDPWQEVLWGKHGIEVPIIPWPAPPKRLLRISAQVYNAAPQYRFLAQTLRGLIANGPNPVQGGNV